MEFRSDEWFKDRSRPFLGRFGRIFRPTGIFRAKGPESSYFFFQCCANGGAAQPRGGRHRGPDQGGRSQGSLRHPGRARPGRGRHAQGHPGRGRPTTGHPGRGHPAPGHPSSERPAPARTDYGRPATRQPVMKSRKVEETFLLRSQEKKTKNAEKSTVLRREARSVSQRMNKLKSVNIPSLLSPK